MRAALTGQGRAEFERDYRDAMDRASSDFDLTPVQGTGRALVANRRPPRTARPTSGCSRPSLRSGRAVRSPTRPGARYAATSGCRPLQTHVRRSPLDEARAVAAALPLETKKILAELLGLLEIEPYTGDLYRPPDSDLRTAVIADGRLLVIWLVLDDQDQVEVVRIIWSGNDF